MTFGDIREEVSIFFSTINSNIFFCYDKEDIDPRHHIAINGIESSNYIIFLKELNMYDALFPFKHSKFKDKLPRIRCIKAQHDVNQDEDDYEKQKIEEELEEIENQKQQRLDAKLRREELIRIEKEKQHKKENRRKFMRALIKGFLKSVIVATLIVVYMLAVMSQVYPEERRHMYLLLLQAFNAARPTDRVYFSNNATEIFENLNYDTSTR